MMKKIPFPPALIGFIAGFILGAVFCQIAG